MGGSHPSVEAGGSKTTVKRRSKELLLGQPEPADLKWTTDNNSAAAYAVRSTLSDAELAQARTAFFETDRDGSGAIDRSELARMLKSLGQTPTKRMVEEIFIASDGGADANGNGKIELREFLNWYSKQLQKKNQTAQDDVANVYRALGGVPALDLDKGELDGGDHGSPAVREQKTISKPELQARLKAEYDLNVNEQMMQEIFPGSYANPGSPVKELKLKDFEALLLGSA